MTDTEPQIAEVYRRLLMARTPAQRFEMGLQMCAAARATVIASLPPQSAVERKVALLRRYYGGDFSEIELAKIEQAVRSSALPSLFAEPV